MYIVYEVKVEGERAYIGYTKNLRQREYNHNYHLRRGTNRLIYTYLRNNNVDSMKLIPLKQFTKRVDAKRYEAYLILKDYFNNVKLLNKIPSIRDGGF